MGSFDQIDLDMERDPRTMTRDELLAAVLSMKPFFDRYGQLERRYEASDLFSGWSFFSPVGRWEKVETVDHDEPPWVRVWTDKTGPDYCWFLSRHDKLEAVSPYRGYHSAAEPELRIVDLTRGGGTISAVLTFNGVLVPDFGAGSMLVHGRCLGVGKGWEVAHRPAGGAVVTTQHESKAKAMTAVKAAARAHAKALKVPMRVEGKDDR